MRAQARKTAAIILAVSSHVGSIRPADHDASAIEARNTGSSSRRATAALKAAASPGDTFNAAALGAVSAAAPPVVQTIGKPRAMASPSTMPYPSNSDGMTKISAVE
jgi:hypothetical protein